MRTGKLWHFFWRIIEWVISARSEHFCSLFEEKIFCGCFELEGEAWSNIIYTSPSTLMNIEQVRWLGMKLMWINVIKFDTDLICILCLRSVYFSHALIVIFYVYSLNVGGFLFNFVLLSRLLLAAIFFMQTITRTNHWKFSVNNFAIKRHDMKACGERSHKKHKTWEIT